MREVAALRAAPDLDAVPHGDDLLLSTASVRLRLDGGAARYVRDVLLPHVRGGASRADLLAEAPEHARADVARVVDRLLDAGMLEADVDAPAWARLVTASGAERRAIGDRLRDVHVAVLGLRGAGRLVAETLAGSGVGHLLLADHYPVHAGEERDDGLGPDAPGTGRRTREEVVADAVRQRWPTARVTVAGAAFTREQVGELVADQDLVVTAVEPGLVAVRSWVNEACLDAGVPSLHAAVDGATATVGPLVVPGEGPCYLCWRMRALACEQDFPAAMAREQHLDRLRRPGDEPRPALPSLPPWVAGVVTREVLAATVGVLAPQLPGRVLSVDARTFAEAVHPVLPRPDCPACGKKADRPPPRLPTRDELADEAPGRTDFDAIAAAVVDPLCGLVRVLDRLPKDVEEPERPVVAHAELANAQFLPGDHGFVGCSGKGGTFRDARDGALGEALERYASLTWVPDRRVSAARPDLDGPSLDPRRLVLFADDQYAALPFAPYREDSVLDWVAARSLVTRDEVWVPQLAAHLGYDVRDGSERLFPTSSNGFAAGATLGDAVLRGLLEVVERDAFLIAWAHRLAGSRSDAASVPDDQTRTTALAYARRGVHVDVHRLPVDAAATVVLAVAWAREAPAAVVGLGADLDPVVAARKAVLEVAQVRPALRARLRDPRVASRLRALVADPGLVAGLEDHDLLYADPAAAAAGLGYLRDAASRAWDADPAPVAGDPLGALVDSLAAVTTDVLYVDVTPPDVASLGVRVARGIVPDFQPIHFGAHEWRLGGDRLATMPATLGLRDAPAARSALHLAPHPLA